MRAGQVAAGFALAVAVFAATLAFTFPTDALVRAAVARYTPPGYPTLVFARAGLRPRGLLLEQVALRRSDGYALASADWAELQLSWRGLLRDGTGRPWGIVIGACGGKLEGTIAAEGVGHAVGLSWRDLDLGGCAPLQVTGEAIEGVAEGLATLRLDGGGRPAGEGNVRIRSAAWRAAGRLPGLDTLHADPALVRFTLREGRLVLDGIDLYGPDLEASGSGTLRLAGLGNLARSSLDVALAVAPGSAASPLVRDLLATLPPADTRPGAYRLALTGTLAAPRLVR